MDELDTRPPVPHITFADDALPADRKREVSALTADLVRSAAGDDAFSELWLAEALGAAMAGADTAALVLCDLADLVVMLTTALAKSQDLPASDVLEHLAHRWVEPTG